MSNKRYIYGKQFAQKLPGSNQNFYFRTVTGYLVDNNGKPIKGSARTDLYYAPLPAARTSDGKTWTPGKSESIDGFNPGGWVRAGSTADNGKTYTFRNYSQEDADLGRIPPGKKVGDEVLGATTQQSLTTSGGRFYEAVQNNLINLAVNTEPGLAQVVSAKQANAVQQQQQQQQQGSGVTDEEIKNSLNDLQPITLEVGTAKARSNYGNYYYPQDIENNQQDRIRFTMFKYAPATLNPRLGQRTVTRTIEDILGSVTLPITGRISDSNNVDWSGGTLNAVQATAAAASLKLMKTNTIEQFGEVGGKLLSESLNKLAREDSYGEALKIYLAQEAVGIQNLLSRATGAILNPNMELLFNGPSLRSFDYQFKMSPRDVKEAKQVRSIIRFFKQGMSVKTTEENVFLKAPNVFSIEYQTSNPNGSGMITHPSINIIKKCALITCDVNYTPDGTYMTYDDEDRTMTSYDLTLRFGELEPIYDEDYNIDGNKDLLIGY